MKIGTMLSFNTLEDMHQRIANLVEFGIDSCQLCSWNPALWTAENAAVLKELFQKYPITVSAFWCGWSGPKAWNFYEGQKTLGLVPPEYRQTRAQELCLGADFAKMLGISDVVTHMGFIPENPYDPEFEPFCDAVRQVALHLKKNGQWLLFETGQETPVTMLRCFETVGCDNLAVNLDTANLILYGKANPVDALDVFGKFVRNIHAKDGLYPVNGHDLGEETRLGEGEVDFPALFRKLKGLGYDSFVTIEREIEEGTQQQRDIVDAKAYLENTIAQVYGG